MAGTTGADGKKTALSRREFTSVAAAAAAGFLLTACGPRRLHAIPPHRQKAAIRPWERDNSEK